MFYEPHFLTLKGIPGSHFQTLIGGSGVQLLNFREVLGSTFKLLGGVPDPKVSLSTVLAPLLHHANLFYKAINSEVLEFSQIGVYKRIPLKKFSIVRNHSSKAFIQNYSEAAFNTVL